VRERVALVRVEAGRDEDQIRRVRPGDGQHDLIEQREPQRLARARRHGQVDRVPLAAARTGVLEPAGAREQPVLVDAGEQHVGAVAEDLRRAVAGMDVPVEDQHTRGAKSRDRGSGRDRDVVEEAEAHRARRLRVVACRTHAAEAGVGLAGQQQADHLDRTARGVQRGVERRFADVGVRVDRAAALPAQRRDRVHVAARVDELEVLCARRIRFDARPAEPVALAERALECEQPLGRVRVPGREQARIVLQARGVAQVDTCSRGGPRARALGRLLGRAGWIVVHCRELWRKRPCRERCARSSSGRRGSH
jgi:hypothetical protein